jgi:striatin 1/3/4
VVEQQVEAQTVAVEHPQSITVTLTEKFALRNHFDMVRSVLVAQNEKVLVTVSEDCMVKLWSLPDLQQKWTDNRGNLEPYLTLRGHTGPLLCASGRNDILFTAGIEGVVKVWALPLVTAVNQYGDTFEGKNYQILEFSTEEPECIWDLSYHPY